MLPIPPHAPSPSTSSHTHHHNHHNTHRRALSTPVWQQYYWPPSYYHNHYPPQPLPPSQPAELPAQSSPAANPKASLLHPSFLPPCEHGKEGEMHAHAFGESSTDASLASWGIRDRAVTGLRPTHLPPPNIKPRHADTTPRPPLARRWSQLVAAQDTQWRRGCRLCPGDIIPVDHSPG